MRRKHDGLSIFAPYYERINNQYDIERVLLEFHIEVQKKPEFFKECIGIFYPVFNPDDKFHIVAVALLPRCSEQVQEVQYECF